MPPPTFLGGSSCRALEGAEGSTWLIVLLMKRTTAAFAALLISAQIFVPSQARADTPPSADTTCSFTDNGAQFSANLIFSGGNWTLNGINYDWEYAILNQGQNPGLSSSYGARALAKTTIPNGTEFKYEELLALAAGKTDATIIIFSVPKLIIGSSTVTNAQRGSGCYVSLVSVLQNKNTAASKPTQPAQPTDSPTSTNPTTGGDSGAEEIFAGLRTQKLSLDTQIRSAARVSKSIGANLAKIAAGGMPKIPENGSTYSLAQAMEIKGRFDAFLINFSKMSAKWIADFNKRQKNTCVKGGLRATVKAGSKCPPGFKRP